MVSPERSCICKMTVCQSRIVISLLNLPYVAENCNGPFLRTVESWIFMSFCPLQLFTELVYAKYRKKGLLKNACARHFIILNFLPASHGGSPQLAGPNITLRFLCLVCFVALCVHTYHVHNNYVMYIVAK